MSDEDLPGDLVAPFGGDDCCGTIWLAPLGDVVAAAAGRIPLVSPCCGEKWRIRELGKVAFFSRGEWETAADDEPPQAYFVESAYVMPR